MSLRLTHRDEQRPVLKGGFARGAQLPPWTWAALALLLLLSWQGLTVYANCEGHWNGLFRTGRTAPLPPRLALTTFRNAHHAGYDGQFYRLLAYDPFLRMDTVTYLDMPLLRSRRILVPLLAWVFAGGNPRLVDAAYFGVMAAFIFTGVYCLTKLMMHYGRHPALGLLFLLVPAVPIAIDSMTVDVALAALVACFAFQTVTGRERGLWWVLAAACLVRETGVLLPAACVITALIQRDIRRACFWATAALPAIAWYGYLYQVLPPAALSEGFVPKWFIPQPKVGVLLRTIDPPPYPLLTPFVRVIVRVLDFVALLGTLGSVVVGSLLSWKSRSTAVASAFALYLALLVAATDKDFWNTPNGYARPIAPLFVLLLVAACERPGWRALIAAALLLVLVDVRVCAEMEKQIMGVLRFAFGG
jgi:hypothetical protein